MSSPMPLRRLLVAALACGLAAPACADQWQTVMRDRGRVVDIDRGSIIQSDSGTKVAWGRIVLTPQEAEQEGYATIKALNRYDCLNRSFYTIKRVYLDANQIVLREEPVADQNPVTIGRAGVDERMWREVCRPASAADLQKVAAEAGRAASAAVAEPIPVPGAVSVGGRKAAMAPGAAEEKAAERAPVRSADFRPVVAGPKTAAADSAKATPAAAPMMPSPAFPPPVLVRPAAREAAPAHAAEPAPRAAAPHARSAAAARASKAAKTAKTAEAPAAVVEHRDIHWSYEGETGPEHWASLRPEWKLCGDGARQSPIDIRDGVAVDLDPVRLDYRDTRFRITDNGHTIQVDVGDGMSMEVRGRRYDLVQIHFHRPSEERFGGRAFDMVAHFVHRDIDGHLAVLAVPLERGDHPNALIQTLWNNLPLERNSSYLPEVAINPAGLLPPTPEHYLYMGSLTTPPCTEDVLWVVMRQPVQISDDQLRIFARLYPRNSRPIQPVNGRLILESR